MLLNKREISGLIIAPLAAPIVFMLQGGFGAINYNEVIKPEFTQSVIYFVAVSALVWLPITMIIGVPIYLYLRKRGLANTLTLTTVSTIGCYLMSMPVFEKEGSVMFALCGFVVAILFSLIVRPGKNGKQINT